MNQCLTPMDRQKEHSNMEAPECTLSIPMDKPEMKPYQQASIAQTTKQKWKRSSMQHTPSETEWTKTQSSF